MRASRASRVFMWVGTIGFTLAGAMAVVNGPGRDDRMWGAFCIVFFGAGGAFYLCATSPRPAPEPVVDVGRTDLLGISESALTLPMRPMFPRRLVLAGAIGVGALLLALGVAERTIAVTVAGALLLLVGVYAVVTGLLRRGTPERLILTATGIGYEHPVASIGVRWDDVRDVELYVRDHVENIGVDAPVEAIIQRTGSRRLAGIPWSHGCTLSLRGEPPGNTIGDIDSRPMYGRMKTQQNSTFFTAETKHLHGSDGTSRTSTWTARSTDPHHLKLLAAN